MKRGVIFEHRVLGEWARVAAIDEETAVEVVVTGPSSAARFDLEQLALRKLERKLATLRTDRR